MSGQSAPTCKVVRPRNRYKGKQGFNYLEGISSRTVRSQGVCMLLQTIPPHSRAMAHKHEHHETAIYVLSGAYEVWHGEKLEHHLMVSAGEFLYIPAGIPHLPLNDSNEPVTAIVTRTDPREQESVVLLPELDSRVPMTPNT